MVVFAPLKMLFVRKVDFWVSGEALGLLDWSAVSPKRQFFIYLFIYFFFFEKPRVRNETQKSTFLTNSTFERWLVDKQQTTDPAQYAWLHRVQFSATRILIRHGKLLDHIQFIWNYKLYFCSYCISSRCSDFIKSCFTLQKMLLSGK